MKKKMKRAKAAKARWEQGVKGKIETVVRKFSRQWKIQERIDAVNTWATNHPKRTAAMTIGALVCSLGLGILVSLYTPQPSKDIVGEIENVQSMFAGLQSIQNGKNVQVRAAGSQSTTAEMGVGFPCTHPGKDTSGFYAHHL